MHSSATVLAFAAAPAMAAYAGFNYGSTFTTGAAKVQSDFESEFKTAQSLISAPTVFNSARLYTMIVSTRITTSQNRLVDNSTCADPHSSKAAPQTHLSRPFLPPSALRRLSSSVYGRLLETQALPMRLPP